MKNRTAILLSSIFAMLILLSACSSATPTATTPTTPLDGATLVQERCSACHPVDRVTSVRATPAEWTMVVEQMVARGANLSTNEQQTVISYLSKTYSR